jgi:hypothetical protein
MTEVILNNELSQARGTSAARTVVIVGFQEFLESILFPTSHSDMEDVFQAAKHREEFPIEVFGVDIR